MITELWDWEVKYYNSETKEVFKTETFKQVTEDKAYTLAQYPFEALIAEKHSDLIDFKINKTAGTRSIKEIKDFKEEKEVEVKKSLEFQLGDKIELLIGGQKVIMECNSFHDMKCKYARKKDYCFSDETGNLRLTYTREEKINE